MHPNLALINTILAAILAMSTFGSKAKGYKWLSLILASLAILSLFRWGGFTKNVVLLTYLPFIMFPLAYFGGPAILFYVESILFNKKERKLFWYMVLPVGIIIVHIFLIFAYPNHWTLEHILNWGGVQKFYQIVIGPSVVLNLVIFALMAFYRIHKYNLMYQDTYSDEQAKNTRWIYVFIFGILLFLFVKVGYLAYATINNLGVPFNMVEELVLLSILLYFIYYLTREPMIKPFQQEAISGNDKKYAKINLSDTVKNEYAKKLEEYMVKEQPFLEEKLSLPQIAVELDIPQHLISLTINAEFEQNFYNYVNQHRIKYAEKLLVDPAMKDESILSIAFASGFQSKSVFNRAFKLINQITPTEHRKKYLTQAM